MSKEIMGQVMCIIGPLLANLKKKSIYFRLYFLKGY